MSFIEIHNVSLRGVSACVPKKIIENKECSLFTEEEANRFIETTGIKSRRSVEGSGVCSSDLCFYAAEKLMKDLGWEKSEIGLLVFVSQTPDYRSPATSCVLQHRLHLSTECMCFDIPFACSGYVHGLAVASNLLNSGFIKKALLLVGDTSSITSSPQDKSRYPLFGDAGTATALEYDEKATSMKCSFYTDGSGFEAIITPHSGFRNRITPESFIMHDFGNGIRRAPIHGVLDGMEVFSFGISKAPKAVNELCGKFGIDKENDVDYFLFHQANLMMNEKIRSKLKIPINKVPYNLDRFGNTSCATIPLLMVTDIRTELQKNVNSLLLCAFGQGLSWGCIYVCTKDIVCSELLEI